MKKLTLFFKGKRPNLKGFLLPFKIFLTIFLLYDPFLLATQETPPSNPSPQEKNKPAVSFEELQKIKKQGHETFKTGVFISNIHDIKHADQEFQASFWIWFLHSQKLGDPIEIFEIKNSKSFNIVNKIHIPISDGRMLSIAKVKATISKNWKLNNYPFDANKLEIRIESTGYGSDALQYLPDCQDSILDTENIKESLDGWYVEKFDLPHIFKTYPTNFGNPEASYKDFSRVIPTIYIKRDWLPEFIKYFTILYLAVFFTTMAVFIKPKNKESKINLISISVASIIVSRFIVSSTLPNSTGFSLYTRIENYTFLFIVFTTFITIVPDFYNKLSFMATKKFRGKYLLYALPTYFLINVVFISIAYYKYLHVFDNVNIVCHEKSKEPALTEEIKKIIKEQQEQNSL